MMDSKPFRASKLISVSWVHIKSISAHLIMNALIDRRKECGWISPYPTIIGETAWNGSSTNVGSFSDMETLLH